MAEDINDQASDFTASSVALSSQTLSRLEDINTRYIFKKLWFVIQLYLQSFQPSADRFCSWLTRIEETAAKLESDGEKLRTKYR